MFEENKLWRERLGKTSKELGKYFRYIFNGHVVIVLVFLIGTAAYYYQEWVKTLSPDFFPASLIMAALLAVLLTYSPIFTMLMEADRIFLLPLESRLEKYFNRTMVLSFFVQVYLLIIGLGVFMPLYARVNGGDFKPFFMFLIIMCVVKLLNILIRWRIQYFVETRVHMVDSIVRYCVNAVFLYFLFSNGGILFVLPVFFLLIGLFLFYQAQTKHKGLKWEFLIDQEERRMMSFYRLANMFTDVPKLKDRVKRRRWLDWIARSLPYRQDVAYFHLMVNTFVRGGDYLGLVIRLTVIGIAGLYLITFGYGQILFVVLFLFLTGFQLLPLWNHHQNKIWVHLYPIKDEQKKSSFQRLLNRVLAIQGIFLSIPLFAKGEWVTGAIALIAAFAFNYFFVNVYSKKKLEPLK
ncbi:ABC transporter permease [Cytobacillus sp. FJAT-54145]|uniref:ABC transporter permease n=1 Tax=Cytobacillus spartinae TaxID=3299023 RepID=A0ABW6KBS2_9BACI